MPPVRQEIGCRSMLVKNWLFLAFSGTCQLSLLSCTPPGSTCELLYEQVSTWAEAQEYGRNKGVRDIQQHIDGLSGKYVLLLSNVILAGETEGLSSFPLFLRFSAKSLEVPTRQHNSGCEDSFNLPVNLQVTSNTEALALRLTDWRLTFDGYFVLSIAFEVTSPQGNASISGRLTSRRSGEAPLEGGCLSEIENGALKSVSYLEPCPLPEEIDPGGTLCGS